MTQVNDTVEQVKTTEQLMEILRENGIDLYSKQPVQLTEYQRRRMAEIIKQYAPKRNEEGWIVFKPKR